jgi:hypothetical protein
MGTGGVKWPKHDAGYIPGLGMSGSHTSCRTLHGVEHKSNARTVLWNLKQSGTQIPTSHHQNGVSYISKQRFGITYLRKHTATHPRRQRSWHLIGLAPASPGVSLDNQNPVADVTARNPTAVVFSGDVLLELRTAVEGGGGTNER